METTKKVTELYQKELEEIEEQIEFLNAGEICDFQLINKIKYLAIAAYYDGKRDGINEINKILKNYILKSLNNFFISFFAILTPCFWVFSWR